jgi:aminoglycoside phosphotransferase
MNSQELHRLSKDSCPFLSTGNSLANLEATERAGFGTHSNVSA